MLLKKKIKHIYVVDEIIKSFAFKLNNKMNQFIVFKNKFGHNRLLQKQKCNKMSQLNNLWFSF